MAYGEVIGEDQLVGLEELVGAVIGADSDVAALLAAGDDHDVGEDFSGGRRAPRGGGGRGRNVGNALRNLLAQHQAQSAEHRETQAMARRVGSPMVVRNVEPDRKLRIPAGFTQLVTLLSSATITIRPQTLFRAEELIIPEVVGVDFNITGLTIGQISLMTGSGFIPAQVFSEKSFRATHLDWPTNQPTQEILLTVANTNAANKTISGCFYGRAAF